MEYLIVQRCLGSDLEVVSAHLSTEARNDAFVDLLIERFGARVKDYTEYSYAERGDVQLPLKNLELWAVHLPCGEIERQRYSVAQIQEGIRTILRNGGFVNPQMNRCIPRAGSSLTEIGGRKFIQALWAMTDLKQYPRPSPTWFAGPWGLPDVQPQIFAGPCHADAVVA